MIGFVSSTTRTVMPATFATADGVESDSLPTSVIVTSAETNAGLAVQGLGLIQVPRYRVEDELAGGALVEVLAACPPPPLPVHLLRPEGRQLFPGVRVFIDWVVAKVFTTLSSIHSRSPTTARSRARPEHRPDWVDRVTTSRIACLSRAR